MKLVSGEGALTHMAVIESEPLLRAAWEKLIRSFSSCWVAGSYNSFEEFYIHSNGYPFDVFLLRPDDSWTINWQDIRNVRARKADAGIVVLLSRSSVRFAPVALQSGANAVISTAAEPSELHEAILSAATGRKFLCKHASRVIGTLEEDERNYRREQLSTREADVLALTAKGLRLKEIAEQIGVTVKTAHSYRIRAMQKLGLQNTAQIIRYTLERSGREEGIPPSAAPSRIPDSQEPPSS